MASAAEQLAANMNVGAFARATELHKRLWFTLGALIMYRLGTFIPIPGIDLSHFEAAFSGQAKGILGMFNMFSGGAVQRMAIFSLNVMPYISASIIVQLMGTIYGPWEKLRKEGGEAGRKTLNQYTRYLAVFLALVQSFGIAIGLQNSPGLVDHPGVFFILSTMATLSGGTLFLMWLVICSPSHIRNIVPPTSVTMQETRKNQPGSITALPTLPWMLSSPIAMP